MREHIIRFGQPVPINGILTEHANVQANSPCILIMNSGLMHHVGTCRFSVLLARNLANAGFTSLRFDFPGIGDSSVRRDRAETQQNSVSDIRSIMDQLEEQNNFKQFILYGLCSGAYDSYHTALLDKRVVGIAQIDPYTYRSSSWYWRHYLPRLFNISLWPEMITDKLQLLRPTPNKDELIERDLKVSYPPQGEVEEGYNKIIAAGIKVLIIATFGANHSLNHKEQLFSMFSNVDWRDQLSYQFLPNCSHIITEPKYQKILSTIITEWVTQLQCK